MTDIYGTPEKVRMKAQLFRIAVEALKKEGWEVEKVPGSGKSSVRRITNRVLKIASSPSVSSLAGKNRR